MTTQEDSSAKRPDQVFLLLKDAQTGLDISYPFSVKDSGKSRVELVCNPRKRVSAAQLTNALQTQKDHNPEEAVPTVETERYGKKPEIHHIFKDSASSPPIVITLTFVAMVSAAIPALAGLVS